MAAVHQLTINDGVVLIGSDYHKWPGYRSAAFSALIRHTETFEPVAVILDGDMVDGASISRHGSIGWERKPTINEEIQALIPDLDDLIGAHPYPDTCDWVWPFGNHDERLETLIANKTPELRGLSGVHLRDHFPAWEPCWTCHINAGTPSWTVVLHTIKMTKGDANTKDAGTNIVTGHDHKLYVMPFTDYRGTRYAVHGGTLSAGRIPVQEQFINYTRGKPLDWQSGFTHLTFSNGRLLPPEQVSVISEKNRLTAFRGQLNIEGV